MAAAFSQHQRQIVWHIASDPHIQLRSHKARFTQKEFIIHR